jgi:hypothetical protein
MRRRISSGAVGGLLGCTLAALLIAGGGAGAQRVETTIQDDAALLHGSEAAVQRSARQMSELGADRVRITASWSVLAPAPGSRRKPAFDAEDTRTYPFGGLHALDRAIVAVKREGLDVQLDLAFWAPRWATRRGGRNRLRSRYAPDPRAFAAFARAVARRYSGTFSDPEHGIVFRLPRVRMYTTWNEPNHPYFLLPQWKRTRTGYRPYSPHLYRPMHELAYRAIKDVDPDNTVLIGGLAATGSHRPGRGGVPPLEFLRTLACVDDKLLPLTVPECRGVGALHADGFAMHPYSVGVAPGVGAAHPDDVYLADLGRLSALIGQLHALGRTDAAWPIYVTEYGYETRPPDPKALFSPVQQARFMGWATFLADSQPDVRMFAQFLLRDIDKPGGRDFQTGLLFADGRPKPAARAFKLPLFATTATAADGSAALLLFGGVRPGNAARIVRIERRAPGTGGWVPVTTLGATCDQATGAFLTERDGFFRRTAPWEGPGDYRIGWEHGGGVEYGPATAVDEPSLIGR